MIFVNVVTILIADSLLSPIYRTVQNINKRLETLEEERNKYLFTRIGGVEAIVRDSGKVGMGMYILAAFVGLACGCMWIISPFGVMYFLKRRVSKVGDLKSFVMS